MKRLAIIPARGGSKRIPQKNIRQFCGHPMIWYILHAAKESALFDTIHVSTDCQKICETVENIGFSVDFLRPAELADDYKPIMPTLKYVTETYQADGQCFDQIWLLMACAPLVEATDLIEAERLLADNLSKPVMAIAEYPAPVEWAFRREGNGDLIPLQPGKFSIRSQDLAPAYYDAGAFIGFPVEFIANSAEAGSDSGYTGYILTKEAAIDIDTFEDWELAEKIMMARKKA